MGPDHPYIEVWNESKHGVMYHAKREQMGLENEQWNPGKEYFSGPTCASCHMISAGKQSTTRDVGERISLTLRPPISTELNMVICEDGSKEDILGEKVSLPQIGQMHKDKSGNSKKVRAVLAWQERRENMQELCKQCHSRSFVRNSYVQFNSVVDLYNDKFAKPAMTIIDELRTAGLISPSEFDD
jgi:hydroxylamine dehydrogenase